VQIPGPLDEQRIQEIVDKVLSRLGPQADSTPMQAVLKAAERGTPNTGSSRPSTSSSAATGFVPPHLRGGNSGGGKRPDVRIPRGSHGLFPDMDSAVTAARKAFDQYQSVPLATRERMVAAMRKVTLDNLQALSEYAVAETGLTVGSRTRSRRTPGGDEDTGTRDPSSDGIYRRSRPDGAGPRGVRDHRLDHSDDERDRDDHQQRHRHAVRRQRGRLQYPSVGVAGLCVVYPPAQRGDRPGRRAQQTCCVASLSRASRARRK
jgi:hypothetical protein